MLAYTKTHARNPWSDFKNDQEWYVLELNRGGFLVAEANLRVQGFSIFHPQMWATVNHLGTPAKRLVSVFPGYCFVKCNLGDGRLRAISSTRGVKRFAGLAGTKPAPLPQSVMAALMERCPNGILEPWHTNLGAGHKVRTEDCVLAGWLARVLELDDFARVKFLLSLLGTERIASVPHTSARPLVLHS